MDLDDLTSYKKLVPPSHSVGHYRNWVLSWIQWVCHKEGGNLKLSLLQPLCSFSSHSNIFITFCSGMVVLNMSLCFIISTSASFSIIHNEGEGPWGIEACHLIEADFVYIHLKRMYDQWQYLWFLYLMMHLQTTNSSSL